MKLLASLLSSEPPAWLPWAVLALVLLLLAVIGLTLWWLFRRRDEPPAPAPPAGNEAEAEDGRWLFRHLRGEVRRSLRTLAELSDNGGNPYSVPWIVAAGLDGADTAATLAALDPASGVEGVMPRAGMVRFCRHGAVFHAGDMLLGTADGLRRWRRLVRLLTACRPHRPLDGLVLTVPVDALAGPHALPFDRLADRGARLSEMIASVQRITGLRVPVTVVLTRCESLRGFSALTESLGAEARGEALGWPVPYSLDTAYQADWADQAVDGIAQALSGAGIHLLMAGDRVRDPDSLMLLPSQVRGLAGALRPLLAAMFQPSAYHESFLFRGLFLTGGGAFAAGLFDHKVFREYQLVRPVRGVLTRRTRRLRVAQAVLAVSLAAEALALGRLSVDAPRRAEHLQPLLVTMRSDLERIRAAHGDLDPIFYRSACVRLLQELARLDVDTLKTPLAPTSYPARPNGHVERAITAGYDGILVGEIRRRLSVRLDDILRPASPAASPAQLESLVSRLEEFDRVYRTYNDLPTLATAAALALVARYTLDIELPHDFLSNAHLYQVPLGYVTIRPLDRLDSVTRGLQAQFAAANRARFDAGTLRHRLERIAQLTRGGDEPDPVSAFKRLTELQTLLKTVEADLDSRDYGWINGEAGALGTATEALLGRLDKLSIVPHGTSAILGKESEQQMAEARRQVFSLLAADRVPLLQLEGGKAVLAPDLVALGKQLDALMARPFMAETLPSLPSLVSGSRPILWDSQWLKTAQRLVDDYLAFGAADVAKFPPALALTVELAAFDQASQRTETAVAAAARPAERALAAPYQAEGEVKSLAGVAQALTELDDQLRRARMDSLQAQFEATVQTQGRRLLTQVDALAADLPLMARTPDFDWWDGSLPLAARTFRAPSLAELAVRLDANRDTLGRLARDDAAPVVRTLVALRASGGTLAAKWEDIARAIAVYGDKDRDSSLRRLEQFILTEMDKTDPSHCEALSAAGPNPAGDFFSARLDELRGNLARRCSELALLRVRDRYARLQALFNETLAGRFPFAADALPQTPRAESAAVRRFFWLLAQDPPPPHAAIEAAAGPTAAAFVDALGASRKALAPMLAEPTLDLPLVYEVEAEFRTNPSQDRAGNQIIEWTLDLGGDQHLSSQEPGRKAVWSAGQPVRLSVRFARNAPSVPVASAQGRYRVDGAVATWEARDPWALLSLVADLATPPARLAELADHRPQMLTLSLDLGRNPDAASGGRAAPPSGELFLRLGLTAVIRGTGKPEEKMPILLPQFPAAAPSPGA